MIDFFAPDLATFETLVFLALSLYGVLFAIFVFKNIMPVTPKGLP